MHQSTPMAGAQARIVVLDGNERARRELIGALHRQLPGLFANAATSGRQAVEMLRRNACDMLLVDLSSALDLANDAEEAVGRLVRSATGALVVVLSEGGSVSAAMGAMRSGAHEFIARPVERTELLSRLTALARRHGRGQLLPQSPEWLGEEHATGMRSMPSPPETPVLPMWRQEQRIIEEAIRHFAGNITMAAAALELSPSTIYRKRQAWAEMDGRKGAA